MGSPAKARENNRVQHTSKEVGIAYGTFRPLGALQVVRSVFSRLALLLFRYVVIFATRSCPWQRFFDLTHEVEASPHC